MVWYGLYMAAHLLLYFAVLRHLPAFRTERTIFLYHAVSAVGVTLVVVIAARPGPGTPVENLSHGWNVAAVVTALVSVLGAAVVLACRPRRTPQPAEEPAAVAAGRTD